jgi:hypothetical protein
VAPLPNNYTAHLSDFTKFDITVVIVPGMTDYQILFAGLKVARPTALNQKRVIITISKIH